MLFIDYKSPSGRALIVQRAYKAQREHKERSRSLAGSQSNFCMSLSARFHCSGAVDRAAMFMNFVLRFFSTT